MSGLAGGRTNSNWSLITGNRFRPFYVVFRTKLLSGAVGRHIPDLAEDIPFHPRTIVFAETPKDPRIGVRVAAVQTVFVVQMFQNSERFLIISRPRDDIFAPKHPDIIMDLACFPKFALDGVPKLVVGLSVLQLLGGVNVLSFVIHMFPLRLLNAFVKGIE